MKQYQTKEAHPSSFWFGFALGTIALGAGAFLLGTKRGRATLHKLLDFSENMEENLIEFAQEVEEVVEEKIQDSKDAVKPGLSHHSTLSGLLNKMHLFSETKTGKKVFTKQTKVTD